MCLRVNRQPLIKKLYLHAQNTDYYSFSTTLRAHLFGKIDFFLLFCPEPRSGEPEGGQNNKKKSILPNKCARKVVEKRLDFSDTPF